MDSTPAQNASAETLPEVLDWADLADVNRRADDDCQDCD